MVKIQKLQNNQLVITIPKKLAELLDWNKGDDIIFKLNTKESFILEKKRKNE